MPPVVVGVVATIGSVMAMGISNVLLQGLVIAAIGFGATKLSQKYMEIENHAQPDYAAEAKGRTQVIRSAVAPRKKIYGTAKISGPLAYTNVTNDGDFIHLVIPLAGHEVQEIGDVYFNDQLATEVVAKYTIESGKTASDYYIINKHLGASDQEADADLLEACTDLDSNFRLRGIAYLYIKLKFDVDVFPNNIPNICAIVKGAKLYDPRLGQKVWSDNWALCIMDYLIDPLYGPNIEYTHLNEDSFISAANISDEETYSPGGYDWDFPASDGLVHGFTAEGASLSDIGTTYVDLISESTDPIMRTSSDLEIDGSETSLIRIRFKRLAGTGWDGTIYYTTASHGESESYKKDFSQEDFVYSDEVYDIVEVDMHDLTAGGTDWKDSTITQIRFDFGNSATDQFRFDYIKIGKVQNRYTCNGVVSSDENPASAIDSLLSAGMGDLIWTQGEYRLYAGAYSSSAMSLNEDNLRDSLKVRPRSPRKDLFNGVKGVFVSPDNNYQLTDFPVVKESLFQEQDGEEIIKDISLPFTDDAYAAQRIAKLILMKARQPIVVEFPANFSALNLSVCETVDLTIDSMGWVNKEFTIKNWKLSPEGGVDLLLQEEAEANYSWGPEDGVEVDPAADTSLPDATVCNDPSNLVLASGSDYLLRMKDGTIISRIYCTWDAPNDAFVVEYNLQYKRTLLEDNWTSVTIKGKDTNSYYISPVQDGTLYSVRVRAVNILGVRSGFVTTNNYLVVGKTELPPDVDTFLVAVQSDGTREFSWTVYETPSDLAGYEIRAKLGTDWTWDELDSVHTGLIHSSPWESNQLAAGAYTFAIKMVDTTGNKSLNARFVESTLADPRMADVVLSEYPHSNGWPGTKTNCWVDNDYNLVAKDTKTWADFALDNVTWAGWTQWARSPHPQIIYEHTEIDLGSDITVTPVISVIGDGTPTIEIKSKEDGGVYGDWGSATTTTARYFTIRVTMNGSFPVIRSLNIVFSGKSITEEVNDLDTSALSSAYRTEAGDMRIPLAKDFNRITQVMVALQSVGAGWDWVVVDKLTDPGPRIKIYNSSGALADATIDVFIRGM